MLRHGARQEAPLPRLLQLPPPDDRRVPVARRRPRPDGGRRRGGLLRVQGRRVRRARAVPRDRRRRPRLCRSRRRRARRQGQALRRHGPAVADDAQAAGRVGRGHCGGQRAALWRADGLRRPPRRLPRVRGGAQAPHAGAHHRHLARRGGQARAAHGHAGPRAAHPPRQGHLQHLHRPGTRRGALAPRYSLRCDARLPHLPQGCCR